MQIKIDLRWIEIDTKIKIKKTFWGTVSSICTKYCLKPQKTENQHFEQLTHSILKSQKSIHLLNNRVSWIRSKRIRICLQKSNKIKHHQVSSSNSKRMQTKMLLQKIGEIERKIKIQEDSERSRWDEERLRVRNHHRHWRSSSAN